MATRTHKPTWADARERTEAARIGARHRWVRDLNRQLLLGGVDAPRSQSGLTPLRRREPTLVLWHPQFGMRKSLLCQRPLKRGRTAGRITAPG